MDNLYILRLISSAGFSRVEVYRHSTLADLKQAITMKVNVHPKEQKLFYDMQHTKPLNLPENTLVTKLGLK